MEVSKPISSPVSSPPCSSQPPSLRPTEMLGQDSDFDILNEMTDIPLEQPLTSTLTNSYTSHTSQASPAYLHPQHIGTKCGHILYPFQAPHTPYCDLCLVTDAEWKLTNAFHQLSQEESTRQQSGCSSSWNTARLAFFRARKAYETIATRGLRHTQRKKTWDEAHIRWSHIIYPGNKRRKLTEEGAFCIPDPVCVACESLFENGAAAVPIVASKDIAWWEKPGAMASDPAPQTPRPMRRRCLVPSLGSSLFRELIREARAIRKAELADEETWQRRSRTERAYRRKHNLPDGSVDPEFWDRPLSGVGTRRQWKFDLHQRRMWARHQRGGKLPPLPGSSPLRQYVSIDEVSPEDAEATAKLQEEKLQERAVCKVAEEVGYLYFVGLNAEAWLDDYLSSDYRLVQRESSSTFDDDMMF